MNSLLVFLFLFGGINFCCSQNLRCVFDEKTYWLAGIVYNCDVVSLDNTNNNMNITGHSGIHRPNRNDSDVQGVHIRQSNLRFIPQNIGRLFNLKAFFLQDAQLIEIKAQDFVGMEELEYISFLGNKITSLPRNAFAKLEKLKLIDLDGNQIQEVPRGLFDNNLDLFAIRFQNNRIKFIGSGVFNGLMKLNVVNTLGNVCLNRKYEGAAAITQLQNDMRVNCKIPNEEQIIDMEETIKNLEMELLEARENLANCYYWCNIIRH